MLTLGNKNELLLDDFLFEDSKGITLDLNRPQRMEVSLPMDMPWEGIASTYQTVIQHPVTGKVYLYYRGAPLVDCSKQYTCLALSDDGIHFTRAETGDRNIVLQDSPSCHNFAPFYDTNPDCRENERFKALGLGPNETLLAYVSPDGISWKLMRDEPVITDGLFDSLNTVFFDNIKGVYRCYSRYWTGEGYNGLRAIQSCTSLDFINWSSQVPNSYSGCEPSMHFYTNAARPIPGAEHMYVSIPMRFNPDRKKVDEHPDVGVSDCVLLSSRDGHDWVMRDARPWIYPGLDRRQWTQRNFIVSAGIVDKNDSFSVYISDHYCWDDCAMVRYAVPRMRLGYAYSADGWFITKPFRLDGNRLTFNYNTSALGSLFVDILNPDGSPIDGMSFELFGNELDAPIDLYSIAGKTLRMRVTLCDAYLYAIGY